MTIKVPGRVVVWVKRGAVAVGRAISGIACAVVGIGSFVACRSLSNNYLADVIGNANEIKRIQDGIAWTLFDQCYDERYTPLNDKANKIRERYFRHRDLWERQYRQCVEFFENQEDGNWETID